MSTLHQLKNAYKEGNLILFAGAGVSMNLGLPSWQQLINHIANEIGYDPKVFGTYGDFLQLAEFYKTKQGEIDSLVNWMNKEWNDSSIDITQSGIHKIIATGNFSKVYTTNYDHWLEKAYDAFDIEYTKIVTIDHLTKEANAKKQIIKLHGDLEHPDSMVFAESSYFDRIDFETPLDIKFRSDTLGKPVLFIGYSLTDINIRLLFYKLSKIWEGYEKTGTQPQSYIFSTKPNPVQESISASRNIKMLSNDIDDPHTSLTTFLKELTSTS